jgi:hypothetical protein
MSILDKGKLRVRGANQLGTSDAELFPTILVALLIMIQNLL